MTGAAISKGHVFVVAAPSGTGKTTLCRQILAKDKGLGAAWSGVRVAGNVKPQ